VCGRGTRLKDLIEPELYTQLMEDIELLDELGEELDLEAGSEALIICTVYFEEIVRAMIPGGHVIYTCTSRVPVRGTMRGVMWRVHHGQAVIRDDAGPLPGGGARRRVDAGVFRFRRE